MLSYDVTRIFKVVDETRAEPVVNIKSLYDVPSVDTPLRWLQKARQQQQQLSSILYA